MKHERSAGVRVVQEDAVLVSVGDVAVSTDNADAVITYPAETGKAHHIAGVSFSYDNTPVGRLTIGDGTNTYFDVDITSSGAGYYPFSPEKQLPQGSAAVITLHAGGSGVIGKLSVTHRTD